MTRWASYFEELLNQGREEIENQVSENPKSPENVKYLPLPLTLAKVKAVLKKMKNNKAPGIDSIPAEILKYGGETLARKLRDLLEEVWIRRNYLQIGGKV